VVNKRVHKELLRLLDDMLYWQTLNLAGENPMIFSTDEEEDAKALDEIVEAIHKVMAMYEVPREVA
jgi:predicted ATPase